MYRGVVPYCTACGALRAPLATRSVNMAGKSSKVGGTVARVIGWLVLIFGLSLALGGALLAYALFTLTTAFAVGLPIGIPALIIGLILLRSGRTLEKSGTDTERLTREQAVFALAAHRGGVLNAPQVAQTLGMETDEADFLLTNMAKQQPEVVSLEIDDQGGIYFRFPSAPQTLSADPRFRVEPMQQPGGARVAVDAPTPDVVAERIDEQPDRQRAAR